MNDYQKVACMYKLLILFIPTILILKSMKTIFKNLSLFCLLLFFSGCNQSNSQTKKPKPTNQSNKTVITKGMFTGKYIASYENAIILAELTENQNVVKGILYMDGVPNELTAVSDRNAMAGKLKDKINNTHYDFTAKIKDNVLHLSITFPELNNQIVELLLTKEGNFTVTNKDTNITNANGYNSKPRDKRLIGTWRYTEVISSGGYGGDYASLATDYFIQFKPNGECLSWSGNSAGGTSNVTYDSKGNSNVATEGWYTEGKNVVFYNLTTNEEVSIPFLADENKFLLKGGSTKIYERIN